MGIATAKAEATTRTGLPNMHTAYTHTNTHTHTRTPQFNPLPAAQGID